MARLPPPPPSTLYANPVPFSFFASLVERIGAVAAKRRGIRSTKGNERSKEHRLLEAWVQALRAEHSDHAIPEGTIVLFFRLFFPEEGVRRRYGLQEFTLSEVLETVYGADQGSFGRWNAATCTSPRTSVTRGGSGCLGREVAEWLQTHRKGGKGKTREMTLGLVDELLDELAALSTWSSADVHLLRLNPRREVRPAAAILTDLLLPLSPAETAIMLQIILRDLSPLLYPPPSSSRDAALTLYASTAYNIISLYDALRAWLPAMARLYQAVADVDWVSWRTEIAIRQRRPLDNPVPRIGLPIKVPKAEKPGSCSRATRNLYGEVALETKYDGERLQVHIDLNLPPQDQIRIFSKSGRDSTEARHALLPIIRTSLDLPLDPVARAFHPRLYDRFLASAASRPPRALAATKFILEGEMVPFDESRSRIDEFWKLAFARGSASRPDDGAGAALGHPARPITNNECPDTYTTGGTPSPKRPRRLAANGPPGEAEEDRPRRNEPTRDLHLMIVWFDVLLIDGEGLLDAPYASRRARLETLVRPIAGFVRQSMLSERVIVDFDHKESALEDLRLHFARIITRRCEGLMLKPLTSAYNDLRTSQRWIKLKKDYIPGAGDTLDFHIIGASWQKQRARQLLVPPSVYTTFFIGLRDDKLGASFSRERKPHYHVLFSVSYGLSRTQLAQLCFEIEQNRPERFEPAFGADADWGGAFRPVKGPRRSQWSARAGYTVYEATCTTFTFSLADHLRSSAARPAVIFREPRVMELNGAGFQRSPGCPYYELRFPRIVKSSRSPDSGASPLTLDQLQVVAHEALGTTPSTAAALVDQIWNAAMRDAALASSLEMPAGKDGATSQEQFEKEVKEWVWRLEAADGLTDGEGAAGTRVLPEGADNDLSNKRPKLDAIASVTRDDAELIPHLGDDRIRPAATHTLIQTEAIGPLPVDGGPASPTLPGASGMLRSMSSPGARSDAPSPSQRIRPRAPRTVPRSDKRATLSHTMSCPALQAVARGCASLASRPRLSFGSAVSPLAPALSPSSSGLSAAALLAYPSRAFAWSVYPSLSLDADLPTPRHPFLDSSNFLASPLSVLWVAGLSPASFAPSTNGAAAPKRGPARQGFIFVASGTDIEVECVRWLEEEVGKGDSSRGAVSGTEGSAQVVWVVKGEALETRGMWDLGQGGEVLTVL